MNALEHPLADDVVTIKPFHPEDTTPLLAGRDAEFDRFLSDASPEPAPIGCIWVDNTLVGWVDYDNDDRHWLADHEVNVGYNVFAEHRGKGYGTRAVALLTRFLLAHRPPLQPTLLIHPENTASLALATRAGFKHVDDAEGELLFKLDNDLERQLPDYARTNRDHWDKHAHSWVEGGERLWRSEPVWGIFEVPETELQLLPEDMAGLDAIELGCGTGYVSAWMARRGATVVGIDNSEQQLATAHRLAAEHDVDLELIHGVAEQVPKPDASFDIAVSEYGAAIWSDPYVWMPEAHRLLRTGGRLILLGNHPFVMCCQDFTVDLPATTTLQEPYFGMHRFDIDDGQDQTTEFNLTIADWFKLFTDTGFDVERYQEIRAPSPGPEVRFFVTADWAHRYPAEQVWTVRKR